MNIENFIHQNKTLHAKKRKKRIIWLLVVLIISVITSLTYYNFKGTLLSIASKSLDAIGADQTSNKLTRKAQLIEIENEARAAYGTDVLWIELSREQSIVMQTLCLKLIPHGTALSATGTPEGKIKMCIPLRSKDILLEKMHQKLKNNSQSE